VVSAIGVGGPTDGLTMITPSLALHVGLVDGLEVFGEFFPLGGSIGAKLRIGSDLEVPAALALSGGYADQITFENPGFLDTPPAQLWFVRLAVPLGWMPHGSDWGIVCIPDVVLATSTANGDGGAMVGISAGPHVQFAPEAGLAVLLGGHTQIGIGTFGQAGDEWILEASLVVIVGGYGDVGRSPTSAP
jgi:hypothetical protein